VATSVKFANANAIVTTGWTAPTDAYSDNGVYATAAPGKNATINSDFGFPAFGTGDIPDGATINSCTAEVQWHVSTTASIDTLGVQIHNPAGTGLGSEATETNATTSDSLKTQQVTSGVTLSNLRSANVVVARVRATRGNTNTAYTASLDYVTLTVDYTPNQAIAGSAAGTGSATGAITGVGAIAGTSAASAAVSGTVGGLGLVQATAAGAAIASGTIEAGSQTGAIEGTAAGTTTISGVISGLGAIIGTTDGVASVTGTITGIGAVEATAAGAATVSGTIIEGGQSGVVEGSAAGVATVSGVLIGLGAIAGTSAGVATVTGAFAGIGAVDGLSASSATVVGTITDAPASSIAGTAAGVSTVSGTITGIGAIAGTAAGIATVVWTVTAEGGSDSPYNDSNAPDVPVIGIRMQRRNSGRHH
jgi:hypothetical protein